MRDEKGPWPDHSWAVPAGMSEDEAYERASFLAFKHCANIRYAVSGENKTVTYEQARNRWSADALKSALAHLHVQRQEAIRRQMDIEEEERRLLRLALELHPDEIF